MIYPIHHISIITSCGCNLNCAYCNIDQSKNEDSHRIQQETIKALSSGEFLNNIQQGLNNLNQSSSTIEQIAFWGQEPTLTLNYVTKDLDHWFEVFPNWRGLMFSTNGVANSDCIIDLVKKIDLLTKHEFEFEVQLSYDGDESTSEMREVNVNNLYNNLIHLVTETNKLILKNLKLKFHFHGVLSLEMLRRLNTEEKIINYFENLTNWSKNFTNICTNKNIIFSPGVGLALENPVKATVEDGRNLYNFVNIASRIDKNLFKDGINEFLTSMDALCGSYLDHSRNVRHAALSSVQANNYEEFFNKINANRKDFNHANYALSRMLYCGNGYSELKFMYDGTLINCQNHIFDRDVNFIKDDLNLKTQVRKSLATHNYFINPLFADKKEIDNYSALFQNGRENSFFFMCQSVISLMYWLAKAGQIDSSYLNLNKIARHALYVTFFNCCSYNNQTETASIYLRHCGFIKLLCNGFLDYVEEKHAEWRKNNYGREN